MDNVNVTITNQQHKSNAPWILGIIAFCTSIPNILCATLCAAAATGVSSAFDETTGNTETTDSVIGGFLLFILISVLCFILSFFGKSKISVITGILLILGAIFILTNAFIGFGSMLWGTVSAILYLIGGIFSIINNKRIA